MLHRYLIVTGLFFLASFFVVAQNPACDGFRYKQEQYFQSFTKNTVPYATATNHQGQTVTLSLDVYQPSGDTASVRPVVILAHGGSFMFGDKADMSRWCELLAKRGYVAVSIQYRLYPVFVLGFPDSTKIMDTAVKAVGDMKAAVRFFREDAATSNQFRADTNHIFIGGYSAGAVAALHTAYLDEDDNIPVFMKNLIDANGGIEGNSGSPSNQSYSSAIRAVVNMSGGLYRREWIVDGDPPLSSIHGTADATVPFNTGLAANIAYLEGSGVLHAHALEVGSWSYLKTIPGGGHTNIYDLSQYSGQLNNYWMRTTALLEFMTCYADTLPQIISGTVAGPAQNLPEWTLYPNPIESGQRIFIGNIPQGTNPSGVELYDLSGRRVRQIMNPAVFQSGVPTSGLVPGIYFVQLLDQSVIPGVRKLIVK